MRLPLVLAVLLAAASARAAAADMDAVFACMRANIPDTVRIQTVELTAFDRGGGQRQLRGKVYGMREKGLVRLMMKVAAPPDLAGAAYLVREATPADEMYMFLPALNRTRRITGAALDGKLWGTDLSYTDLKQVQNAFSVGKATAEPPVMLENRPTYVFSMVPKPGEAAHYSKVRAFVDQKTCVAMKAEFYEGAAVRKEMSVAAKDLLQSGKYWYAGDLTLKDLKDGTHTRLRVLGVSSGDKLSTGYFNPAQFQLGN